MKSATNSTLQYAPVVELADTPVLETGCESSTSSSLVRRTLEKVVYSNVYDMTTLSTNEKKKGAVTKGKNDCVSLRKNRTFHFIITCVENCLSTSLFNQYNSIAHVRWSCRHSSKDFRRQSHVQSKYKECSHYVY